VGDHCVVVPSDVVSVSKLYVDEVYEISCLFIVPDFINLTLLLGIEKYFFIKELSTPFFFEKLISLYILA
jgi:hypothetical protein